MVKNTGDADKINYTKKHMFIDLFFKSLALAAYVAAWYYFEPFKIGEGMGGNQQSKMSFEIKKAHDVDQRLSDVKGINEIKDEVSDLIKMIKNTSDYTSKGAKLYKGVLLAG